MARKRYHPKAKDLQWRIVSLFVLFLGIQINACPVGT